MRCANPLLRLRIPIHFIMIPPRRRRARLMILRPSTRRISFFDVLHPGSAEGVGKGGVIEEEVAAYLKYVVSEGFVVGSDGEREGEMGWDG